MLNNYNLIYLGLILSFFSCFYFINRYYTDKKLKAIISRNEALKDQIGYLQLATEKLLIEFEKIAHENNRLKLQIDKLNSELEIVTLQIKNSKVMVQG